MQSTFWGTFIQGAFKEVKLRGAFREHSGKV
jgi:hypothetical protein